MPIRRLKAVPQLNAIRRPPAEPPIGQKNTKPIPQQALHRRNGRDWPVRYDEALPEMDKAANVGVITVVKPN